MKSLIKLITILTAITVLVFFFGCEKNGPVSPDQNNDSGTSWTSFDKGHGGGGNGGVTGTDGNTGNGGSGGYPQFASGIYQYNINSGYQGGTFNVSNSSQFSISNNALTPPPEIPVGDDVTITMLVEKSKYKGKDQLVFTFGPSGCQFNPPAEVIFSYADLGIDVSYLFYIDANGNYVEQSPNDIDIINKKMKLYISHFSRYAVAISR